MSTPSHSVPIGPQPRTATAFLLAPGIAALAGGIATSFVLLSSHQTDGFAVLVASVVFAFFCFALVGYLTAVILGGPIYLVLPEKARRAFAVVVPLAGIIAATPWILVAAPWRSGRFDPTLVEIAFGLGVVAGVAFLFLRRPRGADGEAWDVVPDQNGGAGAL